MMTTNLSSWKNTNYSTVRLVACLDYNTSGRDWVKLTIIVKDKGLFSVMCDQNFNLRKSKKFFMGGTEESCMTLMVGEKKGHLIGEDEFRTQWNALTDWRRAACINCGRILTMAFNDFLSLNKKLTPEQSAFAITQSEMMIARPYVQGLWQEASVEKGYHLPTGSAKVVISDTMIAPQPLNVPQPATVDGAPAPCGTASDAQDQSAWVRADVMQMSPYDFEAIASSGTTKKPGEIIRLNNKEYRFVETSDGLMLEMKDPEFKVVESKPMPSWTPADAIIMKPAEKPAPIPRATKKMALVIDASGLPDVVEGALYDIDGTDSYDGKTYYVICIDNDNAKKRHINISRVRDVMVFTEPPRKMEMA